MKKLVLALVVIGAAFWGYQKWRAWKPDAGSASLTNRPTTAVVDTRDIKFSVTAAGDIGPAEQVSVRPEVNGRIEKLGVDIGSAIDEWTKGHKTRPYQQPGTRTAELICRW